jgi:membrane-associated phospholipid phosphatase
MSVTLLVVAVVVAAGLLVYGVLALFARRGAPLDTEREERWFVMHAPAPLRHVLRYADRRVAGGAAVTLLFIIVFVSATAIGWIFDSIDENQGFASFDQRAAEFGADHSTTGSTRTLEAFTQFGATGWLLIVMAVIGALEAWHFRKLAVLGYLAVVGIGVSLINNGLKHIVQRERPAVLQLTTYGGYSFPSGHTAAAAACWAAIALVVARRWRRGARRAAAAAAVAITLAVGTSRVLLGVHWLTDVIAGAIMGWAWFMLVTLVFGGRILRFGEPTERISEDTTTPDRADRQELEVSA